MPDSSHSWLTEAELEALLQARREASSQARRSRSATTATTPERAARLLRFYALDERNHRIQDALHRINPRHISTTRSPLPRSDALRLMERGFTDQLELDDGPQTWRDTIRNDMRREGLL